MAKGRVDIVVSVKVDTDDDMDMETVAEELAAGCSAVFSKEVVMIEFSDSCPGVYSPRVESVGEHKHKKKKKSKKK